jgi:shikimate dehydrogenase
MDRYAVIGHPVEHSLSPTIHGWFAEQTGQRLEYTRLPAPPDGFARVASRFLADGGLGLNVTVPFKHEAAAWVDRLDPLAREAAAVNTIRLASAGTEGFNTDGIGLVRDIEHNHAVPLAGRRLLLIGAGGAAAGVMGPLLRCGPVSLHVANRTAERARRLVARFAAEDTRCRIAALELGATDPPYDVVINATSAGLEGLVVALAPATVRGAFCYDMVYGAQTAFCRWSTGHGAAAAVDGIGMLVEQAAESFRIWRGLLPDTAPVLARLRAERERP